MKYDKTTTAELFNLERSTGKTYGQIAGVANARGFRKPHGGKWDKFSVGQFIRANVKPNRKGLPTLHELVATIVVSSLPNDKKVKMIETLL